MRFFIDKDARRAYLFADTKVEEISVGIIFSHIVGAMPNTVRLVEAQEVQGFQAVPKHIEFKDSGARVGW